MGTIGFDFAKLLKTYIRLDYLQFFKLIIDVRDGGALIFRVYVAFIQFDNSCIEFDLDTDASIFAQMLLIFKDISVQKIYLISK